MQQEDIAVTALPSGLFADSGAFPMNAGFASHAWEADQRIARLTGQAFSDDYRRNVLESGKGRVDSGSATLALTAVHLTAPEREFEALKAIQRARYVEGRDNGDAAVIGAVLDEQGLDQAAARFRNPDKVLLATNRARIDEAQSEMRRFGARGVPTMIVDTGAERCVVESSVLYGQVQALIDAVSIRRNGLAPLEKRAEVPQP